jgi:hypothetical protein
VTAVGDGKPAGDGGEHQLDFVAEADEDGRATTLMKARRAYSTSVWPACSFDDCAIFDAC